jgi:hypothetical protein
MALFTVIVSEIMTRTSSQFKGWYIGVSQDMLDWSAYGDRSHTFQSWDADTLKTAETIKQLFIDLGMTDCTASQPPLPGKQTYVYIFKK